MPGLDPRLCALEKEPLETLVLESFDHRVSVTCNGIGYKQPNAGGEPPRHVRHPHATLSVHEMS